MRSPFRTVDPIVRNVAALCAASFVVGLSFGAIAAAAHLPLSKTVAMSLFVYAGSAQFLAVGIVAAGGTGVAIVLAGLLLNTRLVPFGLAVGDAIGDALPVRLAGSHLLSDETVAFALAEKSPAARRRAYWITGVSLFLVWNVAAAAGAVVGSAIGDPGTFGVDAAFPAALLALLMPSLRERRALRVAGVAAVLALAGAPFLPAGLPVLIALGGLIFALPVPSRKAASS